MRILLVLATLLSAFFGASALNACDTVTTLASGKLVKIVIDGQALSVTKVTSTTTLAQLRQVTYLNFKRHHFFFYKSQLIETWRESEIRVGDIVEEDLVQLALGNTQAAYTLIIRTAPKQTVLIDKTTVTIRFFEETSLYDVRTMLQLSTTYFFYINSFQIVIKDERTIRWQEVYLGGDLIIGKDFQGNGQTVTKETIKIALDTFKIDILIQGKFTSTVQVRSTTTLIEVRTQLKLTETQFFFARGCLVYQSNEQSTKVTDILEKIDTGNATSQYVIIKNAPQVTLVVSGKGSVIYTFWDASLTELRTNLGLSSEVTFTYLGLNISRSEESFILIKEVQIGSFIYATGGAVVVPPVVVPPVAPANTKEAVAAAEKTAYNGDVIGKIGITGAGVTLDAFGNPTGPEYDLVKDGALSATILIYDNHGGIGTNVAKVGLNTKGLTFNVTTNETYMAEVLD